MEKLFQWRAKRSGGRITIYAKTGNGQDRKVPHVDTIEVRPGGVIVATDKDTASYHLSTSA